MEVKESAACGIAEREFTIEMSETEIVKFYKFLDEAGKKLKDDTGLVEDQCVVDKNILCDAQNIAVVQDLFCCI